MQQITDLLFLLYLCFFNGEAANCGAFRIIKPGGYNVRSAAIISFSAGEAELVKRAFFS